MLPLAFIEDDVAIVTEQCADKVMKCIETTVTTINTTSILPYDVVLLDIEMPRIGGIDIVRRLREKEQHEGFVRQSVVAITSYENHLSLDAYKELERAGFDMVLSKQTFIQQDVACISPVGKSRLRVVSFANPEQ